MHEPLLAGVQGNVKEKSISEIWKGSENLNRFRGCMNVQCPPKQAGGTFPQGFFENVLEAVKRHFAADRGQQSG